MKAFLAATTTHLFQGLVIHKARRILGHFELALLDLLAKLPVIRSASFALRSVALDEENNAYMMTDCQLLRARHACTAQGEQSALGNDFRDS